MKKASRFREIDKTNPEMQALLKAMQTVKDKRHYQRYQVIMYYFQGYTKTEIAKMVCLSRPTIDDYINKYKIGGLDELKMNHSPGAPGFLAKEQELTLIKVITNQTPDEVGFPNRKNWNLKIIRQWLITTFNSEYSISGVAQLLHRLNLSYTRPTYTLAKADPNKQEEFICKFEHIKKPS